MPEMINIVFEGSIVVLFREGETGVITLEPGERGLILMKGHRPMLGPEVPPGPYELGNEEPAPVNTVYPIVIISVNREVIPNFLDMTQESIDSLVTKLSSQIREIEAEEADTVTKH